jgi:aryl-alcohol dehydrogenase-like predicted oxidoreductase
MIKSDSATVDVMDRLHAEGKIGAYLLEIYHSNSDTAGDVVRQGLCDGVIFYWNVVDREVSNDLFDLLQNKRTPIVSLRALGGGPASYQGPPDPSRARALLDELRRTSGCSEEFEFRLRFALSLPGTVGTVAATRSMEHLERLIEGVEQYKPLEQPIADAIHQAHRQWFEHQGMA